MNTSKIIKNIDRKKREMQITTIINVIMFTMLFYRLFKKPLSKKIDIHLSVLPEKLCSCLPVFQAMDKVATLFDTTKSNK
ncbi:hypothetical protein [Bacillus chungangensis]|uniref:Transposase n=1 Tax=Bacillus chungangensis TaxID=587633 RepID=A0ABT9WTW6_9BACI|nr:hypothetical protein [Bacillus chungangensis]MDQ0176205.1 hypothetical protein [Bacillus chungangensis]